MLPHNTAERKQKMGKNFYLLSGSWVNPENGDINTIAPQTFLDKESATRALKMTYDIHRMKNDVPDAISDENGESIPGGCCDEEEAKIYVNAEYANDCLVQVAHFIITEMPTMERSLIEQGVKGMAEMMASTETPSALKKLYATKASPVLKKLQDEFTASHKGTIDFPNGAFSGRKERNTRIDFLYRDASNYKVPNTCVIEGVLSKEDIKVIIRHLYDTNVEAGEGWFIPSMVGLDGERFSDETEDDHPFFELSRDSFSITEDAPDTAVTAEGLVHAFLDAWGAGWGEDTPYTVNYEGYMPEQIADIDSILSNDPGREHTAGEIAEMEYTLHLLERIWDLWETFGDLPMDPETECLEVEWMGFPAGTFREDVWRWFESEFGLSVAENLMGQ